MEIRRPTRPGDVGAATETLLDEMHARRALMFVA